MFKRKEKFKAVILIVLIAVLSVGFLEHKRRTDKFFVNSADIKHLAKHVYYSVRQIMPKAEAAKILDIKFHRQEHSLSCEIAALKTILDWRGVLVTEGELLERLAFSDRGPRQPSNIWGDPDLGFVGDIDGKMPSTGYGVYEKPIHDVALNFRDAEILNGASLSHLLDEFEAGNPSIVWGVAGSGQDISWRTKDGKLVKAVMGEHTRVLMGFTGDKNEPEDIILMDPLFGMIEMDREDFLKEWAVLGNRAVVVF